MKNKHQENAVRRGPLILMVPASNLVAIMSLDWRDGIKPEDLSAKTRAWNCRANRSRAQENLGGPSKGSIEALSLQRR
jgi:hypothetical protein